MKASQGVPHQICVSMSLSTSLCALEHNHVGTGRGHPRIVPTKLGAGNDPKCPGMLKH